MMAAVLAAGSLFIGCNSDTEESPVITVTVTIPNGEPLTFECFSPNCDEEILKALGTTITFDYTFEKGKNVMKEIYVTRIYDEVSFVIEEFTDISGGIIGDAERKEYSATAPPTTVKEKPETWIFEAIDNKGVSTKMTITLGKDEGKPADCELIWDNYQTILFGQSSSDGGSFYSVVNNKVMTLSDANGVGGYGVDFVYFSSTNGSTFASPYDPQSISTFNIGGWSTKNRTRFVNISVETNDNPGPISEWWEEYVEGIDGKNHSSQV